MHIYFSQVIILGVIIYAFGGTGNCQADAMNKAQRGIELKIPGGNASVPVNKSGERSTASDSGLIKRTLDKGVSVKEKSPLSRPGIKAPGPEKPPKAAAGKSDNPFLRALKKTSKKRKNKGAGASSGSNAFLEAIKKAQGQ